MATRFNPSQSRAAAGQVWMAVAVFAIAVVLAAVSRWTALDRRPMHTDEAVQAEMYLGPVLAGEPYHYHPADGHGPVLVLSTRILCALTGVKSYPELTERLLRLTPALYSVGIILLLLLISDGLGRMATGCAALFTAVAPMMTYYGRYYIMETPLVFFTLLAIAGGWRFAVSRQTAWLTLIGVAIGLMHATKETFIIPIIAGVLALMAVQALEYFFVGAGISVSGRRLPGRGPQLPAHLMLALLVAGLVSFSLFSGFFREPAQFFDSFKSYVTYAQRADGVGHEKPWWYFFHLLIGRRDEDGFICGGWPLLIFAAIGVGKAFLSPPTRYENKRLQRFLAFYVVALVLGYSMISYKTPWSILGAEQVIAVLAGLGAASLFDTPRSRMARIGCLLGVLLSIVYLTGQVWRQNFVFPADATRNPYVYSHTSPDLLRLVKQVNEAAAAQADPSRFTVFIVHPENGYPLPWYFRRYGGGATNVLPEDSRLLAASDVIVSIPATMPMLGALVSSTHRELKETFFLRPDLPLRALFRLTLLSDLPAAPEPLPESASATESTETPPPDAPDDTAPEPAPDSPPTDEAPDAAAPTSPPETVAPDPPASPPDPGLVPVTPQGP